MGVTKSPIYHISALERWENLAEGMNMSLHQEATTCLVFVKQHLKDSENMKMMKIWWSDDSSLTSLGRALYMLSSRHC